METIIVKIEKEDLDQVIIGQGNFSIYTCDDIIIVVKDLSAIKPLEIALSYPGKKILEITESKLNESQLEYPSKSRYLKSLEYLKDGYRCFAFAEGNTIFGDLFLEFPRNSGKSFQHPDFKWLGINPGDKDIYLFDGWLKPEQRSRGIAIFVTQAVMEYARDNGYEKLYSCCRADNRPSLRLFERLEFTQIGIVRKRQFLTFKWVSPPTPNGS